MDDAFGVGGIEGMGNRDGQRQKDLHVERAAANSVLQGQAVEEFHGDEGLAVLFADVVNGADIRMVEGGSGLRLALKTAPRLGGRWGPSGAAAAGNRRARSPGSLAPAARSPSPERAAGSGARATSHRRWCTDPRSTNRTGCWRPPGRCAAGRCRRTETPWGRRAQSGM